ncbi:ABC transporter substrate-binding protein [Chloroflexota bacterium]
MRLLAGKLIICIAVLLVILPVLAACDDDETAEPTAPVTEPTAPVTEPTAPVTEPVKDVKITIGNLTDITGPAANSMANVDQGTKDAVRYYNENNLIPGVELEVLDYDTQTDPERFITGYHWLREKGADLILSFLPPGVPVLMSEANRDQFPMYSGVANVEPEELDGSYVFCLGIAPAEEAYTFVKWIAENHPDFPADRPAKIGGAAWDDTYSNMWFNAAREYCEAHPDQYEWEGGHLAPLGNFTWDAEVEALKDCDYVYIPIIPTTFIKSFRQAGGEGTFISTPASAGFFSMIDQTGLWDEFDGALYILSSKWYNEEGPIIDFINQLLDDYHSPSEAKDFRSEGGYRSVKQAQMLCEIIKETIDRVGVENYSTEELVNTTKQWSFDLGEIEDFQNLTETKHFSQNYYTISEIKVDPSKEVWQYMTSISDPKWIPKVTEP